MGLRLLIAQLRPVRVNDLESVRHPPHIEKCTLTVSRLLEATTLPSLKVAGIGLRVRWGLEGPGLCRLRLPGFGGF